MRIPFLAMALTLASTALGSALEPTLSTEPITTDQRDIYRDFLTFSKSPNSLHFVRDQTFPFEDRDAGGCLEGFDGSLAEGKVHQLGADLIQTGNVRLVPLGTKIQSRRDERGRTVKDPNAVTSILSLSEIIFNRKHDRAALAYGIGCGPHCGAGWVALYELRNGKWIQSKDCPTWIS